MIPLEILNKLPSPCWILEEEKLIKNLEILKNIKDKTGVKILLALKGYALWRSFDIINRYLDGCCASGLYEAMLAFEEFQKEVSTYSPAYKEEEIDKIAKISNHLIFNSINQLKRFAKRAKEINSSISIGLRINPEVSAAPVELYNPCAPYSRLGVTKENFDESSLELIEGFHIHALCEEDSSSLEVVVEGFLEKFKEYLPKLKWLNLGGGHHITKKGYNIEKLIDILTSLKKSYPNLELYLEPGEAIGWESGVLMTTVLDIVENKIKIAIVDSSAEAHMPDTIIMPYKAKIANAKEPGELKYTYQIAGVTCLAGDIMGEYSFNRPLKVGDKIIFEDQIHYTMVKATTFNGIKLPAIAILRRDKKVDIIKEFGYCDFKHRLS
ncbi:MAG: carboxynorspermidine decarboxylase [Epsilonproteobacteria bacterium]|nr:carboxynorspermidine decarboxylase [Campylobacterota bacterium]